MTLYIVLKEGSAMVYGAFRTYAEARAFADRQEDDRFFVQTVSA